MCRLYQTVDPLERQFLLFVQMFHCLCVSAHTHCVCVCVRYLHPPSAKFVFPFPCFVSVCVSLFCVGPWGPLLLLTPPRKGGCLLQMLHRPTSEASWVDSGHGVCGLRFITYTCTGLLIPLYQSLITNLWQRQLSASYPQRSCVDSINNCKLLLMKSTIIL